LENLLKEMDYLGVLHTNGRKTLKWILTEIQRYGVDYYVFGSGQGPVAGSCEHHNELSHTPSPQKRTGNFTALSYLFV
jgi:hypothetical protein